MLSAVGLSRVYRGPAAPVSALEDVDLELPAATFVVVAGPSGCGKSTLLNIIGLLDLPSRGSLKLDGVAVEQSSPDALARIRRDLVGFVFQDAGLIPRMSILENVLLPLDYRDMPREESLGRARRALGTVGLAARHEAWVDTLSGGERQRVALARIFAAGPRVVVCDEPTASLDEANSRMVVDHLVGTARRGALVVCASHDPIVVEQADVRISMERGRVTRIGAGP